jgi:signal transduction histidine kinase
MGVEALRRRLAFQRPARRVGKPLFDPDRRRGEILAAAYVMGDLGVLGAWLADPADVTNHIGMAVLMVVVLGCAATLFAVRRRLPRYAGDLAIAGSLVLITAGNLFCRLHVHPGLLTPYYIWVGFASPMWFPRRRAVGYVVLTAVTSGVVAIVDNTSVSVAAWIVAVATLVVAFFTVDALTRARVERERLAAVGEMASVVTHELRNPLAVVTNSVFLLRHALRDDLTPELELHLDLADREIEKANTIIDHLVAFVRPRQPHVEPVAIDDVVHEVLETTPPPTGVRVDIEAISVTALVDRVHLAEVLVNLLSNAYEAMPDGGTVRVLVGAEDGSVLVVVEDTGCGFDRSLTERIFEPFYTTKHSGSGLGLAIVRRLAEINGGEISVDSHAGQGTRFTMTLPGQRDRSASTTESTADTNGHSP